MPHCSPFVNSISPPFLPSPFLPESWVLDDRAPLMKSNLNLLTIPLCAPLQLSLPSGGDKVLLLPYGSEGDVLEDNSQKSIFPLHICWRSLILLWRLGVILSPKQGWQSLFSFFPLFAILWMPHFSYLKISEWLPGGWIESLTHSLRWVKNKYHKFEQSFLHPFTSQ